MKHHNKSKTLRWGLTQQFVVFFTLGAILPVVLLGVFIMYRAYWRLAERQNHVLETSRILTQAIMQRDINSLELSAYQTVDVVIAENLGQYYKTKKLKPLEKRLSHFVSHSHIKFMALYDVHNKFVMGFINGESVYQLPKELKQQLKSILTQQNNDNIKATIENLSIAPTRPSLYYTIFSPIHNVENSEKKIGSLIFSKSLRDLLTIDDIKTALPSVDLTLLDLKSPKEVVYTSNPGFESTLTDRKNLSDKFNYKAFNIYNSSNNIVGEVIIHSKHIEFMDIIESGVAWVIASIVLGIIVISASGFYIHQSFVKPVTRIAEAAQLISRGKLDTQIELAWSTAEVKSLVNNFNKMILDLKHAEESKQHYIAALTHDLKTPLLAESRVFELFNETEEFPQELRPLLNNLIESNNHQLDMVTQLLISHHYEAGEIPLKLSNIDINELIHSVIQHLSELALKNKVQLIFNTRSNNTKVTVDEKQLRRVLINLLINAIENIPPVGNTIELAAQIINGETPYCEITISDNGPGIPVNLRESWFERYASHQLNQKIGSGLGLSICKKIIEQHHGSITINELTTTGTQFIIRLPLLQKSHTNRIVEV